MLVCVCFSVVLWLIKSCRSMDSEMGRAWENTSRGWARRSQWRKPASVGARLLLETQRKRVRSYTHTRTCTRKHTANMYKPTHHRSKINILLICCYLFSIIFVFNPMFCHLHNHVEQPIWMCVYVSASGSSQNVADPHGSNSGLTLFISCFPYQSFIYNIFFHLDHPHVPY